MIQIFKNQTKVIHISSESNCKCRIINDDFKTIVNSYFVFIVNTLFDLVMNYSEYINELIKIFDTHRGTSYRSYSKAD